MSANKTDISQIRKYLNGELDAKAMHRLEREAQDDPFLMDALEGYGMVDTDQQANLDELQQRLADRIAPKKERSIILWRVLPIAASLLIAISIGYLLLKPAKEPQKAATLAVIAPPATQIRKSDTTLKEAPAQTLIAQNSMPSRRFSVRRRLSEQVRIDEAARDADRRAIKADTTQYVANAYAMEMKTNTAEGLLKKLPGVEVDASGNVTAQGNQVNQVRINGKNFFGNNNVNQVVKNLPANVVQNIQIVDDYGDQAARTGSPNKILDIKTDTGNMQQLALNNALAGRVPGINASAHQLNEVQVMGYGTVAKKEVTGSVATIPAADPNLAYNKNASELKAKKLPADSVSYLAEVVVPGYADKNDSPVRPVSGWKQYLGYVKQMAVMLDNSVGKVKLAFKVGKDGNAYDIRVVKGNTMAMNQKAIEIVKNGPVWTRGSNGKEITLKIKFRKGS
ncbi:energy transducer TonB [Mucilaginibacter sp. AW1-3]